MSQEFIQMQFSSKVAPLFEPHRYKVLYGGRGGLKSWSIARALLIRSVSEPVRILCTREFQNSIKESVFKLLELQIDIMNLRDFFRITNTEITNRTGSQFIFTGLHNNVTKIKSMEGIDYAWVEEAETVSEESWSILIPTIRKPGSEIWISFNPLNEDDPVYSRFVANPPPNTFVQKLSWRDNPWISQEMLNEKDYLQRVDPDSYAWVWEGDFLKHTKSQVFLDKIIVDTFKPEKDWLGPFYGIDWGFSVDPTRMVKCWVHNKRLYIEKEFNGYQTDIDRLAPELLSNDPDCNKYTMRGDSARPETISYLKKNGFPRLISCSKGKNSIQDGISFIRSFENIIIHPSCENTIYEGRMYKYKTNKLTGDVSTELEDKFNHSWDAIRYALEPLIMNKARGKISITR